MRDVIQHTPATALRPPRLRIGLSLSRFGVQSLPRGLSSCAPAATPERDAQDKSEVVTLNACPTLAKPLPLLQCERTASLPFSEKAGNGNLPESLSILHFEYPSAWSVAIIFPIGAAPVFSRSPVAAIVGSNRPT